MAKKKSAKKKATKKTAARTSTKRKKEMSDSGAKGPARSKGEQVQHSFTYDDLTRMTGKERNTIYQHVARGSFDPDNLESTICWVARHANLDLKRKILDYALDQTAINPATKKPRRSK